MTVDREATDDEGREWAARYGDGASAGRGVMPWPGTEGSGGLGEWRLMMAGYRSGYGRRAAVRPGRVERPNSRAGECRSCGEPVPAGGGHLWREASGAWSVVHWPAVRGGWAMDPQPYRGGCPAETDRLNAELHAGGHLGMDAPLPASERDVIAGAAARFVPPAPGGRASSGRCAYTAGRARVTSSSRRCEDAPCCGCCD